MVPHGDGQQPGPERLRITQVTDAAHGADHRLLHHVIDVRVPAHGPADDVVDQRQVGHGEAVEGRAVTALGGDHRPRLRSVLREGPPRTPTSPPSLSYSETPAPPTDNGKIRTSARPFL